MDYGDKITVPVHLIKSNERINWQIEFPTPLLAAVLCASKAAKHALRVVMGGAACEVACGGTSG